MVPILKLKGTNILFFSKVNGYALNKKKVVNGLIMLR